MHADAEEPAQQSATLPDAPLRLMFVVPWALRRDATHGGRVTAQLLFLLTERHRVAVVYLDHPDAHEFDPLLAERCALVEPVMLKRSGAAATRWRRRVTTLTAPFGGRPLPVAALHSRGLMETCVRVARSWSPDVIQVEHDNIAYCGPALRESGVPGARVLVCHEPGPLASADQARAAHGRHRLAHTLDVAAWKRYWPKTIPSFDAVVALTQSDLDVIGSAVKGPILTSIGLGIDLPDEPLDAEGREGVVFVGGYRHPPNTEAALRLMRSIMPMVRKRMPGVALTLVGADPGEELRSAATGLDAVTGTVPDVTPYLDRAQVVALPIQLGGGMRVKLLEALASGKAVVASPLAAAGLDAGEHVLETAETDDEFADAIVRLLEDPAARVRLGRNARAWAVANLSWDTRVQQYEALYASLRPRRTDA